MPGFRLSGELRLRRGRKDAQGADRHVRGLLSVFGLRGLRQRAGRQQPHYGHVRTGGNDRHADRGEPSLAGGGGGIPAGVFLPDRRAPEGDADGAARDAVAEVPR